MEQSFLNTFVMKHYFQTYKLHTTLVNIKSKHISYEVMPLRHHSIPKKESIIITAIGGTYVYIKRRSSQNFQENREPIVIKKQAKLSYRNSLTSTA